MTTKHILLWLFCCWLLFPGAVTSQTPAPVAIVPQPVSLTMTNGIFQLTKDATITVPAGNKEVREIAALIAGSLSGAFKKPIPIKPAAQKTAPVIAFVLDNHLNISPEGYQLEVKTNGITITAPAAAGLFYGAQTLLQLLPVQPTGNNIPIPCLRIKDAPRFAWRGLMLDVSRHFFSKEMVKGFIDQMVKYKFNIFHWHLTDDAGWRIQIKSLPELTSIGAWRVPRTGKWKTFDPPEPGEKATDGGFYTQEDIKEVIAYAQQRFVTIVPEIDVPAHTQAFIAAYPSASCTQLPYPVFPGNTTGVSCNVLCAGNETNFAMLDKVIGEVAALFPGPYIHIGGDEVRKEFWASCPKCQQRMKQEGLQQVSQLQGYFIRRVKQLVDAHGKKLIGWDEITQDSIGKDAVIMSWRSPEDGAAAAKAGHQVIMTPRQFYYFNDLQGDPAIERVGVGMIRLADAYNFEPVPDGAAEKQFLGGQGNLWSELIANKRRAEYMLWPRALALSEVLWSPRSSRNWENFVSRVEQQFGRFEQAGINYAGSIYDPAIHPFKTPDGEMQLTFSTEIPGLEVYYTFDYSFPDIFSQKYNEQPLHIPKGATQVWAQTFRKGKPAGRLLVVTIEDLKKRKQ